MASFIRTPVLVPGRLERMETNLIHFKWGSVWIVTSSNRASKGEPSPRHVSSKSSRHFAFFWADFYFDKSSMETKPCFTYNAPLRSKSARKASDSVREPWFQMRKKIFIGLFFVVNRPIFNLNTLQKKRHGSHFPPSERCKIHATDRT